MLVKHSRPVGQRDRVGEKHGNTGTKGKGGKEGPSKIDDTGGRGGTRWSCSEFYIEGQKRREQPTTRGRVPTRRGGRVKGNP